MASPSQQPADCTSQSQMSIDPAVDAELTSSEAPNFDRIFRARYPHKGQLGPSGKRRTKGAVVYECLLCSSDQTWSNPKLDNAIYYAKRKHSDIINSSDNTILERSSDIGPSLKQARLGDYYTTNPSESAVRRTDRRLHLDSAEWLSQRYMMNRELHEQNKLLSDWPPPITSEAPWRNQHITEPAVPWPPIYDTEVIEEAIRFIVLEEREGRARRALLLDYEVDGLEITEEVDRESEGEECIVVKVKTRRTPSYPGFHLTSQFTM
ncbi:hypothetical protein B0J13DRAFT_524487 [Dactylonectria estremocensis]|uniref:Uncharacterized protein n=1 Tax=Dactylonectria estremocensis TaxID=1079267 RepID=A0A9P9EWN5_9HYPO|nr:hypothetical protein B0J13DRAFT_524487 [Dactylonectria estremocensis]